MSRIVHIELDDANLPPPTAEVTLFPYMTLFRKSVRFKVMFRSQKDALFDNVKDTQDSSMRSSFCDLLCTGR